MPRYIDADKMLRFLAEQNDEKDLMVSRYNADWIISFIETQPTADVIPRSDVEKIFAELDSFIEPRLTNNQDRLIYAELKEKYIGGV